MYCTKHQQSSNKIMDITHEFYVETQLVKNHGMLFLYHVKITPTRWRKKPLGFSNTNWMRSPTLWFSGTNLKEASTPYLAPPCHLVINVRLPSLWKCSCLLLSSNFDFLLAPLIGITSLLELYLTQHFLGYNTFKIPLINFRSKHPEDECRMLRAKVLREKMMRNYMLRAYTLRADTSMANTLWPETLRAETLRVKTPRVETSKAKTLRAKTPRAKTLRAKTWKVETPRAKTLRVETPRADKQLGLNPFFLDRWSKATQNG